MKIQYKLNLGFLAVSLFVVFVGAIALWANHQTIHQLALKQKHFSSMVNAADTATLISSHAKRAEGHLMLFLTLHEPKEREEFFKHVEALEDQIRVLPKNELEPECRKVIEAIAAGKQQILFRGKALLAIYDQEKAATGSFFMEKHRGAILSFHNTTSGLRRHGVQLASYSTSFLNSQAAILAATEVNSYAKRAEGHLMLFLTLHNPIDREKFFKRVASLQKQIEIMQINVSDPEGQQIIEAITAWKEKLLSQGEALLAIYDQEKAATGSFVIKNHRETIRSLYDISNNLRQLGIKAEKHNIKLEAQRGQVIVQSARHFQFITYVSIICALIMALVLGHWISKKVTHPLKQLQHGLMEIGKGRLNTTIHVESSDEIRTLAEAFNKMAVDLKKSKQEIEERNRSLKQEIEARKSVQVALQKALDEIKTLRGIIPICSHCKEIRDDKGIWNKLEQYIQQHSYAEFSHGVCPKCAKKFYPEYSLYDDEKDT